MVEVGCNGSSRESSKNEQKTPITLRHIAGNAMNKQILFRGYAASHLGGRLPQIIFEVTAPLTTSPCVIGA